MRLFRKHEPSRDRAPEDPDVRRYRFILRTCPSTDSVHEAALSGLTGGDRRALLTVLQWHAAVGARADPDNLPALARLITSSESRDPGVLLGNTDPDLLRRLARSALASSAASGLLQGYEQWDGSEPQRRQEEWRSDAFGEGFERAVKQRRRDMEGGGIGGGGGGDGG